MKIFGGNIRYVYLVHVYAIRREEGIIRMTLFALWNHRLFACEINNRFVNEKYDMVVPGFRFVLACVPFPMAIVALNISYTLMLTLTRTSITTVCPMQTRKDKDYIDGNQFYTMHLKQLSLLTVKISSNM